MSFEKHISCVESKKSNQNTFLTETTASITFPCALATGKDVQLF